MARAGGRCIVLVAGVLASCSGASISADASVGVDAAATIAPPTMPTPTSLTPCPAGWREVDEMGLVTCDPWPVSGRRTDCAYDEAHFVGEPGCSRIGTACAADGWPTGLPAGRAIVYVDGNAAAGGDGTTRSRALRTIGRALASAPDGAVIAIATGRYDEDLVVSRGLLLVGACVAGTRLTSSRATDADVGALELGAGCGARNLSVDMAERNGIAVRGDGVRLDDLVVHAARIDGIWAPAGSAIGRSISVRDMRPSSTGNFGRGVEANERAHVMLSRVAIEGGAECGAISSGPSAWLELEDIAIHGVRSDTHGMFGSGAGAQRSGRLTLRRAAVEANQYIGVSVRAATAELTDVVVRDTTPRPGGSEGRGVQGIDGATLVLTRVLVERNRDVGVIVGLPGTSLRATSLVVRDTATAGMIASGAGVSIARGATAVLAGVVLERSHLYGLFVDSLDSGTTETHVSDLIVRDTESTADGMGGIGVQVQAGAHLFLDRALLERNREVGLFVVHGGIVDARDVVVRDTMANLGGLHGVGMFTQDASSSLTLSRARIERSLVVGIAAVRDSVLNASDVVVSGVTSGCITTPCTPRAGGFGAAAQFGASVRLERFRVEGMDLCGVVVGAAGPSGHLSALDLSHGSVTTSPVGACVQADGYDIARLSDHVAFLDVGVPLQSTRYSLPSGIGP